MKKIVLIVCLALFIASFCVGCANPKIEGLKKNTDEVIVAMSAESEPAAGFDPAYGWGAGEHMHEPLIQSTLTVTTPELLIENDLATDILVSKNGLVWTVDIRGDVFFTDGEPLTASDVAFTYNTVKQESTVNDFTMLKEAVAIDDNTVEFRMNKPYSIWPYTMAIVGIVPKHLYNSEYGQSPVGSGRYILRQWDKGQQAIFEANFNYYGDAPNIKKLTVVFMSEDAAYAAAAAGQVDLAYTSATHAQNSIDSYNLLSVKTVDNRGINLPAEPANGKIGNDFTADAKVRQAINIGINRQQMIENVLNGYGSPAYSVCDGMPWFNEAAVVDYDPNQAAELLNSAGWKLDGDMRFKDGVAAKLEIAYPVGDSVRQALAEETCNQLKLLGIDALTNGVGWDVAYDRAQSTPLVWGWGAHTPMEMFNIYHTAENNTARYSPYSNSLVDDYMDRALEADSLEESYELWRQAQWDGEQGISADLPWVWLANIDHLYWVRNGLKVAEQKIHPHGHGWSIVNNIDKWEWQQAE